jgi:CRISPR-associated protein Cas1
VAGKLGNSLALVREFSYNHPETDLQSEMDHLATLLPQVDQVSELLSLLGLEGAGARFYYQAFAKMVRRVFKFAGRHRHPAPDPVNALLSLGYTLVYSEISSLLDGLGFDPYLGFYYQPDYGHATLASDLLEEFRVPLVDRLTLSLINNRVFSPEDFSTMTPRVRYIWRMPLATVIFRSMNASSAAPLQLEVTGRTLIFAASLGGRPKGSGTPS